MNIRKSSPYLILGCLGLTLVLTVAGCQTARTPHEPFELVIASGRVMDPETGLDGVRHLGIRQGTIARISETPLEGERTLDASGLVVAPGFIDLHAHGQDAVSNRLQALDGVTTALEMEVGVYPVGKWLDSRKGKALIHFGATAGHWPARVKLIDGAEVGHVPTLPADRAAEMDQGRYPYEELSPERIRQLSDLLETGLDEGALGLGFGITYTPGATRLEILRLFQMARKRNVAAYVHLRGENSGGTLGAFQEAIALAAATGASVHIVHMNSSAGEWAQVALEMIRGARERGLDVTTESYPYTAGSTLIESALFDSWEGLEDEDYQRLQWAATGERLTTQTFQKYRQEGGWVIIHGRSEDTNRWIVAQPDVMVASDGIPFLYGPAHPRGAGTFSRVLGHYVREEKALGLMEALAKMTLLPARRLEAAAPQMKQKGRVQEGADADLTLFDRERIIDRSSYEKGDVPSDGIVHVLVAGTLIVHDSKLVEGVLPGKPILGR